MDFDKSFENLYYETRDALLRYLIPRIRSSADVEDLMQEVYQSFYRHLARKRPVREPLPYLYGIAKQVLSRYYRRRAAQTEREEPLSDALTDDGPSVEEFVIDRDRLDAIWTIVKAEPLQSYQAFTLYYGFSVPMNTIAKELGLSEDAVRKRIERTRMRIRRQLADEHENGSAERSQP